MGESYSEDATMSLSTKFIKDRIFLCSYKLNHKLGGFSLAKYIVKQQDLVMTFVCIDEKQCKSLFCDRLDQLVPISFEATMTRVASTDRLICGERTFDNQPWGPSPSRVQCSLRGIQQ